MSEPRLTYVTAASSEPAGVVNSAGVKLDRSKYFPPGVEILPFVFLGQTGFAWACEICHTPIVVTDERRAAWGCTCHADSRVIPGDGEERIETK